MLSSHPLFNVNRTRRWFIWLVQIFILSLFISNFKGSTLLSCAWLQIRFEMFKQCDFFLKFFWEVCKRVLLKNILLFSCWNCFPLIIIKTDTFALDNNFCWVVEENASWLIWEQITQTVFCWIVNPFCYPNSTCTGLLYLLKLFAFFWIEWQWDLRQDLVTHSSSTEWLLQELLIWSWKLRFTRCLSF